MKKKSITAQVQPVVSNSIFDSFWLRCFWEVYEKAKVQGHHLIVFEDVEKLVIEKAQQPIEELRKFIGC